MGFLLLIEFKLCRWTYVRVSWYNRKRVNIPLIETFGFECDLMFFCLDTKEPKNQGCIGLCKCS